MRKLSIIIAAVIIFSVVQVSRAQETQPSAGIRLHQGEVAPSDGVFFGGDSLIALANALTDLSLSIEKIRALEGQAGALEQESTEKDRVIAALQDVNRNLQAAIEQLKFINSNHKLIEDAYKTANGIILDALKEAREDNRALRNELWWTKVLGTLPIIGMIVTAITAF